MSGKTFGLENFMANFNEDLERQAKEKLQEHIDSFRKQLASIVESNKKSLNEQIEDYHSQKEKLANKMNAKIESRVKQASQKLDMELGKVDEALFNDPQKMYQKIIHASNTLTQQEKQFEDQRQQWSFDDERCADWLGIPYEKKDMTSISDDEKAELSAAEAEEVQNGVNVNIENDEVKDFVKPLDDEPILDEMKDPNVNIFGVVRQLKLNKKSVSEYDMLIIKIDDRVFRTYRGTLTQVKDSLLGKIFSSHNDMIHIDSDGAYVLNRNPETFSQVLEILRNRGVMPSDFEINPRLYASLHELGLVEAFFPKYDMTGIAVSKQQRNMYHVVFQSFRSSANKGANDIRWNVSLLHSIPPKNMTDEISSAFWELDANDDSIIVFKKTDWYRIVFRCCISSATTASVQMFLNGGGIDICHHSNSDQSYDKSYNFNEIRNFSAGDKLRFHTSAAIKVETKNIYLCLEKIPLSVFPTIGVWKSTVSNANYRQWNTVIQTSVERYTQADDNKNIVFMKGGLYRVSVRMHTNDGNARQGNSAFYCNRNGSNRTYYNIQSKNVAGMECHMYDEMLSLQRDDYVMLCDEGYTSVSNANYDCIQVEFIYFPQMVGYWRSSAVDGNFRKWDYEFWTNDKLYSVSDDKSTIEVHEDGHYRITTNITSQQPAGNGYSALYINSEEYCVCRMGCHNGNWYHTTTIQEILKLKAGFKIQVWVSHECNDKDYNSVFLQKLL